VGVLRLPRLRNARFYGGRLCDGCTWREGVLSFKYRRCNETKEYHRAQQSPHENDWLPGNQNVHGRPPGTKSGSRLPILYCENPRLFVNILPEFLRSGVESAKNSNARKHVISTCSIKAGNQAGACERCGTIHAMKTRAGSLIVILFILSYSGFGEQLKPDRAISITSLERYENDRSKGYKVEGKTSEPPIYYKLECGMNASDLQVGHLYKAAEAVSSDETKILVIFDVHSDPKEAGISCDIESERTAARQ